MNNNDVFEDSEYLKTKIEEGRTCALRGRKVYNLQIDKTTGNAKAVLSREYPNLPMPFTTNNYTYFVAPENIGSAINDVLFSATIRGFI